MILFYYTIIQFVFSIINKTLNDSWIKGSIAYRYFFSGGMSYLFIFYWFQDGKGTASEVGVSLKQGYNGDLTSKQAGSVGGQMVKKMIESYENGMKK